MTDRLRQTLTTSRSEIEAGLAEAERELAQVRQRSRELEELIALGTATLLASEMISSSSNRRASTPAHRPTSRSETTPPTMAADPAAADTSKGGLRSRLADAPE